MTEYFYARHGQSTANLDRVVAGQTDVDLTEGGMREAIETGDVIANEKMSFDKIISSPLTRAHDTAKIIAQRIGYMFDEIELHAGLMEKSAGDLELRPITEFYGMTEDQLVAHRAETAEAFRNRIILTSRDIHNRTQHLDRVLIVAHAGVYKIATVTLAGATPTAMYREKSPPNAKLLGLDLAGLTRVKIDN